VDSVTTLSVKRTKNAGEIICTGSVIANLPVRNATIELVRDGTNVSRIITNAQGVFSTSLRIPPGKHTVQARFTGDGYPINSSESDVQMVEATTLPFTTLSFDYSGLLYIAVPGIFCIFIAGAVYYLRRKSGQPFFQGRWAARSDPSGNSVTEVLASDGGVNIMGTTPESHVPDEKPVGVAPLFQRYAGILQSAGLSEASYAVYCDLSARVAADLHISRHRVLTPREMSRSCREQPYCGPFTRLVSAYERIRYGGYHSAPVREEFEATMQTTDAELSGDHH